MESLASLQSELAALQARAAQIGCSAAAAPHACCPAPQAAVSAKEAQLAAASTGAPAPAVDVAAPYSKSFGRTAIVSLHSSAGAGLSLVRRLSGSALASQMPLRPTSPPGARCAASARERGVRRLACNRLGKRCAWAAGSRRAVRPTRTPSPSWNSTTAPRPSTCRRAPPAARRCAPHFS